MRNGTFHYAGFPLLEIETLESAVYPKTNTVLCFLNLTLFGCLIDLWLLSNFLNLYSIWNSFSIFIFLRKGRFLFAHKDDKCRSGAQYDLIEHIRYSASLPCIPCWGGWIPLPQKNVKGGLLRWWNMRENFSCPLFF